LKRSKRTRRGRTNSCRWRVETDKSSNSGNSGMCSRIPIKTR